MLAKLNALVGRRATLVACLVAMFALSVSGVADATATYDLAPVTSGIVDQVQSALGTILPIAGGLLALFVAWRLIRRMVKA